MENSNSIKEIINNSLKEVRNIIDADTIVGQPIKLDNGTTIIPISKVSMGFASGGLDLPGSGEAKNFGGGGGTGVSVYPVGFLISTPDGHVELIPMEPENLSPIEQIADLVNRAPGIIEQVKDIFTGKKDDAAEKDEQNEVYVESVRNDLSDKVLENMIDEGKQVDVKDEKAAKAEARAAKRDEKAALRAEKKKKIADEREAKRLAKAATEDFDHAQES